MIYFITQGEDYAKIGHTDGAPETRMGVLQVGNPHPLVLAGYVTGTKADERTIHCEFNEYRVMGEWFRIAGRLKDMLDRLPTIMLANDTAPPDDKFTSEYVVYGTDFMGIYDKVING